MYYKILNLRDNHVMKESIETMLKPLSLDETKKIACDVMLHSYLTLRELSWIGKEQYSFDELRYIVTVSGLISDTLHDVPEHIQGGFLNDEVRLKCLKERLLDYGLLMKTLETYVMNNSDITHKLMCRNYSFDLTKVILSSTSWPTKG